MKIKIFVACLFTLLAFSFPCQAEVRKSAYNPVIINPDDRVLVFAPHPDDEAIGAGGIIQRALAAGAKVRVVCYTSGDNNEISFIVYEKRLTFKKMEFIHMGEVRIQETLKAMEFLGLKQNDVVFLGYPDFGTMEILTKHWGKTRPFRSYLARSTCVPYQQALSYGAPYVGESILKDIKSVIFDFKPDKIFVSHPGDDNRDHRALYIFLQVALWDMEGAIKRPEIFPYIVHAGDWPKHRGYHPELKQEPASDFKGCFWQELLLTDNELKKKHDCINFYQSQIKFDPPYLFTFARKNELFMDLPFVELKKQYKTNPLRRIQESVVYARLIWQSLSLSGSALALEYAVFDDDLLIRLDPKDSIDNEFGISIFLLGYSKQQNFAKMPKIRIIIDSSGIRVRDKKQILLSCGAGINYYGKQLFVKIPLGVLGNPDYILSCFMPHSKEFSLSDVSWRVLRISQ